jgi:hypothetical protein
LRDGKARNNEAERPEAKRMLKRFHRVCPEPVVQLPSPIRRSVFWLQRG